MTTSSTSYDPGALVLIRFVFTSMDEGKRRPAVILTGEKYHETCADAVMAPLTTSGILLPGDHDVIDWREAGLPRPSRVKAVLQTFHRDAIERPLGRLTPRDLEAVRRQVASILGLAPPA